MPAPMRDVREEGMIRGSQVLLVCLLALMFSVGCEDDVKRSLHDKIMARAEEGMARIKSNLDVRDLALKETLTAVLAKMDEADKANADFIRVRAELTAKLAEAGGEAPAVSVTDLQKESARQALVGKLGTEPGADAIQAEVERVQELLEKNLSAIARPHPLLAWRKSQDPKATVAELRTMEKSYPGTDLEQHIPLLIEFLSTQSSFWAGEMDSREYIMYLEQYAAESPQGPFYDDAMFDIAFVHAVHFYKASVLPIDTRLTSHTKYFQMLFGVERDGREPFNPYIRRVCRGFQLMSAVDGAASDLQKETKRLASALEIAEKLGVEELDVVAALGLSHHRCGGEEGADAASAFNCADMPDEFRGMAIMNPYYDGLLCRLDSMKETLASSPWVGAVARLRTTFARAQADYPMEAFGEYPVFGSTFAYAPASQRLVLEIGPQGVFFGDDRNPLLGNGQGRVTLESSEDNSYVLTSSGAGKLQSKVAKTLSEVRVNGNQGLVGVKADGGYGASAVLTAALAPMALSEEERQSTLNQETWLVGRRRVDGSNMQKAQQLLLLGPKARMTVKVSGAAGSGQCSIVGYTGAPIVTEELPSPTAAVMLRSDRVSAGTFGEGNTSVASAGIKAASADVDWKALSAWATDQKDAVILGIDSGSSWSTALQALTALSWKCTEDGCKAGEPRDGKPNVYVARCK
jgi:hypothetical protein